MAIRSRYWPLPRLFPLPPRVRRAADLALVLVLALAVSVPVPAVSDGGGHGHDNGDEKHDGKHGDADDKNKKKKLVVQFRRDLDFGRVGGDADGGGAVIINPATGAKTVSGLAYDMGRRHHAAVFRIKGPSNAHVAVTLPAGVPMTALWGGGTARLHDFTTHPSGRFLRLDHNGRLDVTVGGTLTIAAGQPASQYRGRFDIDVDFLD